MQQEPQKQPMHGAHAPSEVYWPEQPPTNSSIQTAEATYTPQERPSATGEGLLFYPNRRQAMTRAIILGACVLFLIVFIPLFLIIGFAESGPPAASDIPSIILSIVIILAAIAFIGTITWRLIDQQLLGHKPLLTINREGITVVNIPAAKGYSIAWNEIEAISTTHYLYKYISIRPRNPRQFLVRFNPLDRLIRQLNATAGIGYLIIPQIYLEKPVEEILRELYYMYAQELSYYNVHLQI